MPRTARRSSIVGTLACLVASIVLPATMSTGCYSFRGGSAPAHLHTIYIPQAEDVSGFGRATVREDLTQTLIKKFRNDNSLRIVDGTGADSRLDVTIVTVRNNERRNISGAELETVRGVVVQARATFFDNVKRKPVFKDRAFQADAQYSVNAGLEGENRAFEDALDKLTTDILVATVADW